VREPAARYLSHGTQSAPLRYRRFVFVAACAAGGTLVQRTVGAQAQADESALRNDLRSFTTVYSLVEQNYAEPLNGDKPSEPSTTARSPGMLRVLDPHSSFYDPKAYARCVRTSTASTTAWA